MNGLVVMLAEERTAAGKKGYENGIAKSMLKAGIAWEEKYAEFKRCVEMPDLYDSNNKHNLACFAPMVVGAVADGQLVRL